MRRQVCCELVAFAGVGCAMLLTMVESYSIEPQALKPKGRWVGESEGWVGREMGEWVD